jgi:hypothetical protein
MGMAERVLVACRDDGDGRGDRIQERGHGGGLGTVVADLQNVGMKVDSLA